MTYLVFAYENGDIDLDRVFSLLEAQLKQQAGLSGQPVISITADRDEITLDFNGWNIILGLNESDYVAAETMELLKHLPDDSRKESVTGATVRLEIVSDDDFEEEHFDDYQTFIEEFSKVTGMVVIDPREWNYV